MGEETVANKLHHATPRKLDNLGEPHSPKQWSFPASSGPRPLLPSPRRKANPSARGPAP